MRKLVMPHTNIAQDSASYLIVAVLCGEKLLAHSNGIPAYLEVGTAVELIPFLDEARGVLHFPELGVGTYSHFLPAEDGCSSGFRFGHRRTYLTELPEGQVVRVIDSVSVPARVPTPPHALCAVAYAA